jgi:hypothetical protein
MLRTDRPSSTNPKVAKLYHLYDRYGAMLLGYLVECLHDRNRAESYLIDIFADLAVQLSSSENYTWCQLQRLAKTKLALSGETVPENSNTVIHKPSNKFLDTMTEEQRQVFCHVYYHGKPITLLTEQFNKPEHTIRKVLVEAFAIIRKA